MDELARLRDELGAARESLARAEAREREHAARLIRSMMDEKPWRDQPGVRMALSIASRSIERGRHLTDEEKARNLIAAMESEDWEEDTVVKADVIMRVKKAAGIA